MSDTLTLPRKKTPTPPPRHPGLAIDIHCPLSKKNEKLVSAYLKDCRAFDDHIVELNDRFHAVIEQGPDLPIREISRLGGELRILKRNLTAELVSLRWRRWEIAPGLAEDFAAGLDSARQNRENAIRKVEKRFADQGITAASFPGGNVNPRLAEHQLCQRILVDEAVLATTSHILRAESALHTVKRANAPGWRNMVIAWPSPAGEFSQEILTAANLDQTEPDDEIDSVPAMTIRAELGLDTTILRPDDRLTILEILELTGPTPSPLTIRRLIEEGNQELRGLVEKLPQTPKAAKMFMMIGALGK